MGAEKKYRVTHCARTSRYRCFLPDLAGLAGLRRVGPGTRFILSLLALWPTGRMA